MGLASSKVETSGSSSVIVISTGKQNDESIVSKDVTRIHSSSFPFRAFDKCERISLFTHDSCLSFPFQALEKSEFLLQVDLPTGLQVIDENAFSKCLSLRTAIIPCTVIEIRKCAFQCCFSLLSIELSKGLLVIGERAFFDCYELKNVAIPSTVNYIGEGAFKDCRFDRFVTPGNDSEISISNLLQHRFNGLPIHQICYVQGHDPTAESTLKSLKQAIAKDVSKTGGQGDGFGITPLHMLALSARPNLEVLQTLVQEYPGTLKSRDKWGNLPLVYACRANAPVKVVGFLISAQQKMFPNDNEVDWKNLISIANNLTSIELTKLLVRCSISKRLKRLGSEQWRASILDMIDKIPDTTGRQGRHKHIKLVDSKLEWYEWKEAISLLEIALWKTKIDDLDIVDWTDRSWTRISCGGEVVISNILPFLGNFKDTRRKKRTPAFPQPKCPARDHL